MTNSLSIALLAVLLTASGVGANPGDLDSSFGTGGMVITTVATSQQPSVVVQQPDGKLLVAGTSGSASNTDFTLLRYATDGSLDPSFGTGGVVFTDFDLRDGISSIALQADGRIVAAGGTGPTTGNQDFALARYNADGSLDPAFGTGGKVRTALSADNDRSQGVVVLPDGKIVAAGYWDYGVVGHFLDFALVRYDSSGNLDATFGSGGIATPPLCVDCSPPANTLLLQSDGKLVLGGSVTANNPSAALNDFVLARYNADGTLDGSFGSGGSVFTDFNATTFGDELRGIAMQPDGKLVAAGLADSAIALARYDTNGTLDPSFGTAGKVTQTIAPLANGYAVVAQPDGKLVVGGLVVTSSANPAVIRLNPDGSLDTSFGTGGATVTPFGPFGDTYLALLRQPDGKLVAVGRTASGSVQRIALARYHGACGDAPVVGCNVSNDKAVLLIKDDGVNAGRRKVVFNWLKGNTDFADFGDPTASTNYEVCIFDGGGGVLSLSAAAGESCVDEGCWSKLGRPGNESGVRYLDRENPTRHDGLKKLLAKSSSAGKAKVALLARGTAIPSIRMDSALTYPVTAQVVNSEGKCWEQQFSSGDERRNDGSTFRAVHRVP